MQGGHSRIPIACSAEALQALRYEHFHPPHPRVQMKMAVVQLTALGADRRLVAAMVGCTEATVRTYLKAYRDGGIDALKQFAVGGSAGALDAHSDTLRAEFEQRPARSVKEAQHRIDTLTGAAPQPQSSPFLPQAIGFGLSQSGSDSCESEPRGPGTVSC